MLGDRNEGLTHALKLSVPIEMINIFIFEIIHQSPGRRAHYGGVFGNEFKLTDLFRLIGAAVSPPLQPRYLILISSARCDASSSDARSPQPGVISTSRRPVDRVHP